MQRAGERERTTGLMGASVRLFQPDTNVFNLTAHPVPSEDAADQAAGPRAGSSARTHGGQDSGLGLSSGPGSWHVAGSVA